MSAGGLKENHKLEDLSRIQKAQALQKSLRIIIQNTASYREFTYTYVGSIFKGVRL
jgi:hypothetical protein